MIIGVVAFVGWTGSGTKGQPEPVTGRGVKEDASVQSASPAIDGSPGSSAGQSLRRASTRTSASQGESQLSDPVQRFFAAKTASDALRALNALPKNDDGEATSMALKEILSTACSDGARQFAEQADVAWFDEWSTPYCGNFGFSEDEREEIELWNMAYVVALSEEMEAAMQGMTMDQQDTLLLRWIASSTNYLELQAIKLVIASSFYGAPATDRLYDTELHSLGQHPSYRGEQGLEIQRSAITLLQCQEYVRCDSSSVLVISLCISTPGCTPGWNMNDLLYHSLSPLESEEVLNVLELFLSLRG